MFNILKRDNIPVENLLLRMIYSSLIIYHRNNQAMPQSSEWLGFTHDDTRGCLFDMNGNKSDVVFSLDKPTICDSCVTEIRGDRVSDNCINTIKSEIKSIKKTQYYKLTEFVKKKPVLSIFISLLFGALVSIVGAVIFELSIKPNFKIFSQQEIIQEDSIEVEKNIVEQDSLKANLGKAQNANKL